MPTSPQETIVLQPERDPIKHSSSFAGFIAREMITQYIFNEELAIILLYRDDDGTVDNKLFYS